MIVPADAEEHRAWASGRVPEPVEIAQGLQTLPLPIPPGHMPYTLAYLIADVEGGVHVVDPGWDTDENARAVQDAVAAMGGDRLASIIVTHLHRDHIGLAGRLHDQWDVPVVVHPAEHAAQRRLADHIDSLRGLLVDWGVPDDRRDAIHDEYPQPAAPKVIGDRFVEGGQLLDIPGRRIRALATPGHTGGHLCLLDEDRRMLFSGDHVLPEINPGVGLGGAGDDALALYLDGLERMRAFDDCQVLPGHGYRFHGLALRATELAHHHLRRLDEVTVVAADDPDATVWQVASRLTWSRGFEGLRRQYMIGALRQTAMHLRLVRAGGHERLRAAWSR